MNTQSKTAITSHRKSLRTTTFGIATLLASFLLPSAAMAVSISGTVTLANDPDSFFGGNAFVGANATFDFAFTPGAVPFSSLPNPADPLATTYSMGPSGFGLMTADSDINGFAQSPENNINVTIYDGFDGNAQSPAGDYYTVSEIYTGLTGDPDDLLIISAIFVDTTGDEIDNDNFFELNSTAGTGWSTSWIQATLFNTSAGPGPGQLIYSTQAVPVPAAAWLFGSALVGLIGIRSRRI